MNIGLSQATGEYVLFLNSGDHFCSAHSLSMLASVAGTHDLVYGNLNIHYPNGIVRLKEYPLHPGAHYLRFDTLPHNGTLIRTSLLKEMGGYDTSLKIVADWKFFVIAILKKKASLRHLDSAVADFYYDGLSSKSENRPLLEAEMAQVWRQLFPPRPSFRRLIQKVKQGIFGK